MIFCEPAIFRIMYRMLYEVLHCVLFAGIFFLIVMILLFLELPEGSLFGGNLISVCFDVI